MAGADPNVVDVHGFLPLHYACMMAAPGYDRLMEALLTAGAHQAVHALPYKVRTTGHVLEQHRI